MEISIEETMQAMGELYLRWWALQQANAQLMNQVAILQRERDVLQRSLDELTQATSE